MSNKLYQGVISQMRDIVGRNIGVIDEAGYVVAGSDFAVIGVKVFDNPSAAVSAERPFVKDGKTYCRFGSDGQVVSFAFVDGDDPDAEKFARLIAVSLENVRLYHDEKYDRGNFIKNVILDNILQGDVYLKSRELSFDNEARRCALLIRSPERDDSLVFDTVQSIFPDKNKDFVISINKTDIVLIKELGENIVTADIRSLAASICDTIRKANNIQCVVGIGSVVTGIKDLARSFKEAQISLEVGKVFDTEKNIITYENLGIARLIYQLPTTLCEMFLNEIFKKGSIESLDEETLFTIQKFFENNLNVSETSRKLFVHRNTLVYRLEKIKKLTGLDLREFDDAIVFKVALMVKKYLDARPVKY